ncbi:MAG TPA: ATP-dependent Clp protease adaptor ClpS, partial [Sulfitobacter sp.]|nr:ATP-dependent Clp protease adaptor ClpS [Sulfitobacter sp.]
MHRDDVKADWMTLIADRPAPGRLMMADGPKDGDDTELLTKTRPKTKRPP